MKEKIIIGAICGGIGLLAGYKLTANMILKTIKSEEFKKYIDDKMKEHNFEIVKNKSTFQDIVFQTRTDAMDAISQLKDIIDNYGVASVADLYDISGLTSEFKDNKYGWSDVESAKVILNKNGYSLKMPQTIILK